MARIYSCHVETAEPPEQTTLTQSAGSASSRVLRLTNPRSGVTIIMIELMKSLLVPGL